MFVFDTDILSNITKPRPSPSLIKKLATMPRRLGFTTTITAGEIYFGVFRVGHGPKILEKFEGRVFPSLTILPLDLESARIFGRVKARLEKAGKIISDTDLFIASIALRHGMTLVTGNVKHFAGIPRLKVENWID